MEKKCVLVSYGERNKVISIPESKRGNDLNYLSQEFKKMFSFGDNVNLLLTFQKFDNDWCEYLDLEENCSLSNKDKIKAVVTPILWDDTPLPSMAGTIMGESTQVHLNLCFSSPKHQTGENLVCPTVRNDNLIDLWSPTITLHTRHVHFHCYLVYVHGVFMK